MNMRMKQNILVASLLLQVCRVCWSRVTVSLKFVSFRNHGSRVYDGSRCDALISSPCDHYFVICLDRFDGSTDINSCSYGRWVTERYTDQDMVSFDHDIGSFPNPIKVNINDDEQGVLLKVAVKDYDPLTPHEHVDTISYKYDIQALDQVRQDRTSVVPERIVIRGQRSHTTATSLTIEPAAYCARHFYMEDTKCQRYCMPSSNLTLGYFTCDEQGYKICREGWIEPDENCMTAEVNCENRQCKNKGTCIGGRQGFECNCTKGFTGEDCSVDIDECQQGTGEHGICKEESTVRCENTRGAYICHCKQGFHKDACAFSKPDFEGQTSAATSGNTGLVIGLVVGMAVLLLIVIIVVLLLLRERRKRSLKDQATSTVVTSTATSQQTASPARSDAMTSAAGTRTDQASSMCNYDNVRNQRAVGGAKALEAGVLSPPPYSAPSAGYNNPTYSAPPGDNHVYEVPGAGRMKGNY